MAYLCPFHPFVVDRKGFGSLRRLSSCYRRTAPLIYFTAILSVLPLLKSFFFFQRRWPLRSETTLQHDVKNKNPVFFKKDLPSLSSVPFMRVWLPFQRFIKFLFPRKHISAFNALRFRFPKLYSLSMIVRRFPFSLSVLALFWKTREGLTSVLRRLYPTKRAVLLTCNPKLFTLGSEAFALLSFFHLTGSPLDQPSLRSISLPKTPFTLLSFTQFTLSKIFEPQGFSVVYLATLPLRAPACWMFLTTVISNLLKRWVKRWLFFHQKPQAFFTKSLSISFTLKLPFS